MSQNLLFWSLWAPRRRRLGAQAPRRKWHFLRPPRDASRGSSAKHFVLFFNNSNIFPLPGGRGQRTAIEKVDPAPTTRTLMNNSTWANPTCTLDGKSEALIGFPKR